MDQIPLVIPFYWLCFSWGKSVTSISSSSYIVCSWMLLYGYMLKRAADWWTSSTWSRELLQKQFFVCKLYTNQVKMHSIWSIVLQTNLFAKIIFILDYSSGYRKIHFSLEFSKYLTKEHHYIPWSFGIAEVEIVHSFFENTTLGNCSKVTWVYIFYITFIFYKRLGSCSSPQSCLYFQCFHPWFSRIHNWCIPWFIQKT